MMRKEYITSQSPPVPSSRPRLTFSATWVIGMPTGATPSARKAALATGPPARSFIPLKSANDFAGLRV